MKKRSRKLISILLTLSLLVTLLVPLATPAGASSTNAALTVPNVTVANNQSLGTIRCTESTIGSVYGTAGQATEITVTLPSGVTFAATPAAVAGYVNVPATVGTIDNALVAGDVVFRSATSRSITVAVIGRKGNATGTAIIEFLFNGAATSQVNITSGSGDLAVDVFDATGAITSGSVVNARIVSATTTATALSAPSRTEGNNQAIGDIRIVENSAGALTAGVNTIDLVLPQGYIWNTAPTITLSGGFAAGAITAGALGTNASGMSRQQLNVAAVSAGQPGIITLTGGTVNISSAAALGDCTLSLGGTNPGISAASLVVAKKVEFGVTVEALSSPVVYKGNDSVSSGDIQITENAAGSVLPGRTIRLTLPENASWDTIPAVRVTSGNIAVVAPAAADAGSNNRSLTYTVTPGAYTKSTFIIERGKIDVAALAAVGDVNVTIAGTASATGTVKVAEVQAPVTATADQAEVKIGLQSQSTSDIVIKEVAAGTISATTAIGASRNIVIAAPAGVSFDTVPTVEVTEGNATIDTLNVARNAANTQVIIPMRTSSSTASTIKISGIKITVNRDVPEGSVTMGVQGDALDVVGGGLNAVTAVSPAKVVTTAPVDTKKNATFVIGSTSFSVNGVEQTMDVAPYIKDGRTYLPVRFVAQALGVADANILWDEATQKVTLLKGDKVVQLTIGSKAMLVNGVTITMDVAPELTSDRTMLPFRAIAQAFGATVGWDEATQTVTMDL